MCGVGGIFSYGDTSSVREQIATMSRLLEHRGRDGSGEFLSGPIGLVHRRLAIIDLSSRGNQPLIDRLRQNVISYNGQCYNYRQLRQELEASGEIFESQTDTEVVLKGLGREGLAFLKKMDGQFAFAFWNKREQELWLGRDRIGIKPLYYYQSGHQLIFSSEIKPILALIPKQTEVCEKSLIQFLRYRYSPGENTLFQGIKKLEPGTVLKIGTHQPLSKQVFWSIEDHGRHEAGGESIHRQEVFEQLSASVNYRLQADVPVASYLSGGIDSSAITALAAKEGRLKHSYCFKVPENDETREAQALAKENNLRLTEVADSSLSILEKYRICLRALEEPIGDAIIWPTYRLAEEAGRGHRVLLSGEGADEIFAGYIHHLALFSLGERPQWQRTLLEALLKRKLYSLPAIILNRLNLYPQSFGAEAFQRMSTLLDQAEWNGRSVYGFTQLFDDAEIERITGLSAAQVSSPVAEYFDRQQGSLLSRIIKTDLKFWTPDYTLLRLDRLNMAHTVEARTPFLSHLLVEKALDIPAQQKIRGLTRKWIFREALRGRGILSEQNIKRKKASFVISPERFFGPDYVSAIKEVLLDSSTYGLSFVNGAEMEKKLEKGPASVESSKQIMALFLLRLWYAEFFNK